MPNEDPLIGDLLGAAPFVGKLLSTAARRALEPGEFEAIEKCLLDAMAIDTRAIKPGMIRHPVKRLRFNRAWRAAQQQAAADLVAAGFSLDESNRSPQDGEPSPPRLPAPDAAPRLPASLQPVWDYAKQELDNARYTEPFVPWNLRLSAALSLAARSSWEAQQRRGAPSHMSSSDRARSAALILNTYEANASNVDDRALENFGVRIGQRFEANLCASTRLAPLVDRMDHHDRITAQAATLAAIQGIRLAVVWLIITIVLVAAAVLEVIEGPL